MKTRFFLDMVAAVKNLVSLQAGNFSAILKAYRAFLKETEFEKLEAVKVPLSGVYKGSIVWEYYAKGKKTFSALDQNEFQAAEENRFQNVKTGETVT